MVNLKVCHSDFVDTKYAMDEILKQATSIPANQVKGIIVFASIDFDLDYVRGVLVENFSEAALVGGSSYGEMSSQLGWSEDSLVIGFLYGDSFDARSISVKNITESFESNLKQSFDAAGSLEQAKLCFLMTDSLSIGGEAIIKSVREFLPGDVPIIGGMTADQWTFTRTKQISTTEVMTKGLSALVLCGDIDLNLSMGTGWEPTSKKAVVTKSDGHIVYEINNQLALDFYADVLGTRDGTFGEYPLAIYQDNEVTYFRAPLTWDQEKGSVSFAGAVPEGVEAAISSTSREKAVQASKDTSEIAVKGLGNKKPSWAFVVSCAARRQLLGTQAGREIEIAKEVIGPGVPIIGFNSYGEYLDEKQKYPNTPGFLNESFCVVTIGKE